MPSTYRYEIQRISECHNIILRVQFSGVNVPAAKASYTFLSFNHADVRLSARENQRESHEYDEVRRSLLTWFISGRERFFALFAPVFLVFTGLGYHTAVQNLRLLLVYGDSHLPSGGGQTLIMSPSQRPSTACIQNSSTTSLPSRLSQDSTCRSCATPKVSTILGGNWSCRAARRWRKGC